MCACVRIGHDADMRLADESTRFLRNIGQQPTLDADFIATSGQFDGDYSHASIALKIRCAVSACGASSVTTWICASA